jgi:hypothetical protein
MVRACRLAVTWPFGQHADSAGHLGVMAAGCPVHESHLDWMDILRSRQVGSSNTCILRQVDMLNASLDPSHLK